MKDSKLIKNLITPILTHGLLLVASVVTSYTVLVGYGSETNGLISSVNQIFNYLALLEAGIGTATTQALYTAMAKSREQTQDLLGASQGYFRRSARLHMLGMIATSFLWPLLVDSSIPYWTIWGVVFFQGIANVITFAYCSTITCYLSVKGAHYVNNNAHFVTTILSYLLKLLISISGMDITLLSLSMIAVNVGKCVFLRWYMGRTFPEIRIPRKGDSSLLKQRNSFLIHEISGVIFYSTDTIVISVFCGLTEASIYAVYSLVLVALRNIIGQAFTGTKYVLGNKYGQDRDHYLPLHDAYNSVYMVASFIIYTVAFLLLIPFVGLYTKDVADARYIDPLLPILFVVIELLSASRIVDGEVIRFSYHATKTLTRSITEAVLNLGVSLVCVQFMGIYGVLVGTAVALTYRANDIILYTNHRILKRSSWKEYLLCGVNFGIFALFVWAADWLKPTADSFLALLGLAVVVSAAVAVVYLAVNLLTCRDLRNLVRKAIRK
jgi:O-antigen/teichoic acid export membrane protein